MNITVRTIPNTTPEFTKVLEMAQVNSETLGFLPKGAFSSYATRGQLIGAFAKKNRLIGYLLYAINLKGRFVYLVHLCVDETWRRKGVAVLLFDYFKNRTKSDFRGVRVRCRRDYDATRVWQKLGFAPVGETAGRSKRGSILTIWWFDYGHPDLFRQNYDQLVESKVLVVIDANILFELQRPVSRKNKAAKALLSDWMQENVELCLTQEILTEINRHPDPSVRKETRAFASSFTSVQCPHQKYEKALTELKVLLSKPASERDESDYRQLAWTIGAGVPFFVTSDDKLLRRADKIYNAFGVQLWRPSLLIINQDNLIRETEYQPARLTGSHVSVERLQAAKTVHAEDFFYASPQEKKAEFRNRLHSCLAEPDLFETRLISNKAEFLGLVSINRSHSKMLKIPLLRVSPNSSLAPTLARHLIHNSILTASKEDRILTVLEDPHLSKLIINALLELGFMSFESTWIKVNLTKIDTANNISLILKRLSQDFPQFSLHIAKLAASLKQAAKSKNRNELLQIEKALWPAKITDLALDSFVIPIRPQWALHLFDPNLANQDLFGSEPSLMFNIENTYYRSSKSKALSAPARILWYVSKGNSKFQNTMAIRACSYLEEVVVDKPKEVFARFRRLGVYEWRHVFDIAKKNHNNLIMAFRFSHTELFDKPIDFDQLSAIWKRKNNAAFFPMSSLRTDSKTFFHLYRMGKKLKERSHEN